MPGQPKTRAKRAALAALAAERKALEPPSPAPEVPLVAGAAGVDLKIRSNGAACSYGLTAWSERGREFINRHVLPLPSATVGVDGVWFDHAEAPAVQASLRGSSLVVVMGIGPEEAGDDVPATQDWVR